MHRKRPFAAIWIALICLCNLACHDFSEPLKNDPTSINEAFRDSVEEVSGYNCHPPLPGSLLINEVLADPSGHDINGDQWFDPFEDEFIEILNVAAVPINLRGVSIRVGSRMPHQFNAQCILPGQVIVVFGGLFQGVANDNVVIAAHTLKLPNTGGNVAILDEDERVLDMMSYGNEADGPHSIARLPDGSDQWGVHPAYAGAGTVIESAGKCMTGGSFPDCRSEAQSKTNDSISCPLIEPGDIVINEILADAGKHDVNGDGVSVWHQDEFVELLLVTETSRSLQGLELTVNGQSKLRMTDICLPPKTAVVIFGGGSPQIASDEHAFHTRISDKSLRLPNYGGQVSIFQFGTLLDTVTYGSEADHATSLTRWPEGSGPFILHTDATAESHFSPGHCVNGSSFLSGCIRPAIHPRNDN